MNNSVPDKEELRLRAQAFVTVGRKIGYDDFYISLIAREHFEKKGWPDPTPFIFDTRPA